MPTELTKALKSAVAAGHFVHERGHFLGIGSVQHRATDIGAPGAKLLLEIRYTDRVVGRELDGKSVFDKALDDGATDAGAAPGDNGHRAVQQAARTLNRHGPAQKVRKLM